MIMNQDRKEGVVSAHITDELLKDVLLKAPDKAAVTAIVRMALCDQAAKKGPGLSISGASETA
jgi:hypothetical protein